MTIGRVLVSFIAIFLWTVEAGASVFAQSVESFSAVAITPAGPVSNVLLAPDDFFVDFAGTVGGPGFRHRRLRQLEGDRRSGKTT